MLKAIAAPFPLPPTHSAYNEGLKISLFHWNISRTHPATFKFGYMAVLVCGWIIQAVLTCFNLKENYHSSKLISDSVHSLTTVLHFLIYWILAVTRRADLNRFINNLSYFWVDHEFDDILKQLNYILTIFTGYWISGFCFIAFLPYLGYDLPLPCFIPPFVNYYLFVTFANVIYILGICMLVGYVSFFLCALTFIIVQFKILKKEISGIDFTTIVTRNDEKHCLRKLKNIINHHNFILKCCNELSDLYGYTILLFFGTIISSICIYMYVCLQESEIGLGLYFKFSAILASLMTEIFLFYCLPAEHLKYEAYSMLDAIYESNWYECRYKSIKTCLHIIMIRLQKETKITSAFNMVVVNLDTCKHVFKTGFSFYTFLKNMKIQK